MAAYIQLKGKQSSVAREIFNKKRSVYLEREKEWNSAVKILSWFRRLQVQNYIKHQHESALIIQRVYRGYVGRKRYRQIVKHKMQTMMAFFYDKMATKIQALWRGYYIRKYKANYYARKAYLDALVIKNETVRLELDRVKAERLAKEEIQRRDKLMRDTTLNHRKNHHLLSTKVCRGIYNSPKKSTKEIEEALKNVSPLSREERELLETNKRLRFLKTATGIPTHDLDYSTDRFQPLPPIKNNTKPQGPFRSPEDVQKQRYKELQPTLRVATDYESVDKARYCLREDEWAKRVVDQKFLPSTKNKIDYIPSLHTTTSYQSPDYGTKHFRETGNSQFVQTHSFQRVVSPIPLFDQLGKTY